MMCEIVTWLDHEICNKIRSNSEKISAMSFKSFFEGASGTKYNLTHILF